MFFFFFYQGKENLVRVSGEFELSEFELSRFYCNNDDDITTVIMMMTMMMMMTKPVPSCLRTVRLSFFVFLLFVFNFTFLVSSHHS